MRNIVRVSLELITHKYPSTYNCNQLNNHNKQQSTIQIWAEKAALLIYLDVYVEILVGSER